MKLNHTYTVSFRRLQEINPNPDKRSALVLYDIN